MGEGCDVRVCGLGLGERVDVADCGVEGGVAFDAGYGVAFESFLVEEHVDYFVWGGVSLETL